MGIGLRSVFELIKESRVPSPDICTKALMALLDIIQYQSPEALKDEPSEVIGKFNIIHNNITYHYFYNFNYIILLFYRSFI